MGTTKNIRTHYVRCFYLYFLEGGSSLPRFRIWVLFFCCFGLIHIVSFTNLIQEEDLWLGGALHGVFQSVTASSSERALGRGVLNWYTTCGKSLGYCVLLHSLDGDMGYMLVLDLRYCNIYIQCLDLICSNLFYSLVCFDVESGSTCVRAFIRSSRLVGLAFPSLLIAV